MRGLATRQNSRTMKLSTACLIFLLPVLLAGCEALTPAECATANWRQLGVQDGASGRTDRAADYHESCTKAGIGVDVATYRAGRTEGLQNYCQPGNAINEGLAGRSYDGVCPLSMEQNFRVFHEAAYREQDARKNVARLQQEQQKMQAELRNAKTAEDRKEMLRERLARSDRRIAEARGALRSAEFRLDRLRHELRQR